MWYISADNNWTRRVQSRMGLKLLVIQLLGLLMLGSRSSVVVVAQNTLRPLKASCSVHDVAVCRVNDDTVNRYTGYRLDEPRPAGVECVSCTAEQLNSTISAFNPVCVGQPATNLYCRPDVKECAVCGDFSTVSTTVADDYTITFRKYCNPTCALLVGEGNVVDLNTVVAFDRLDNLHITGAGSPVDGGSTTSAVVLVGPCPLLEFSTVTKLTIDNVVLQCTSPRRSDIFPAILIRDTTKLVLSTTAITAMWYAESALVVLGGQTNVLPVVRSVNLEGSILSTTTIVQSAFPTPAAVVLGLLYGTVDVRGLDPFTRVIVFPVLPPATSTTVTSGTRAKLLIDESKHPLNVKNWTMFTDVMGPDFELEYYRPGEDSEATTTTESLLTVLMWTWVYIIVMFYNNVVFHQDKFYYYTQSKAI